MKPYNHTEIEKKWQKIWESKKPNKVRDDLKDKRKKFYALIEFPFPSGDGLHVGHIRSNTAMDIIARKRRCEGYNVLYPIGWDAFGLPTENYALKTGIPPAVVSKKNSDTFRKQLKSLGFSFDWTREINTTDPKYYKWTQWIFLQFLKKGLAYKKKMTINWCPKDLIGLANEEVIDGCCERCGTKVEKKEKEQWMLAITKYAERLDKDLDDTEFLEKIKIQQRNWIGKSEGAEIRFEIVFDNGNKERHVTVFTTRPDTIFGVTYVVLAPEHIGVTLATDEDHIGVLQNRDEVISYIKQIKEKTDIERTDAKSDKTGVQLKGVWAINPATKEKIPVWVADYVLADYGTGAVMAVPAHDERDMAFAKKYGLPVKEVIIPVRIDNKNPPVEGKKIVPRQAIHALIFHKQTGKILCLKWKKQPWTGFVVGGVESEDGGDLEKAARREILEETGYKNLTFIKTLGGQVQAEFFAAHKDENRIAYTNALVFNLDNEDKDEISDEEKEKHEVIWLNLADLNHENFTCAELDIWKERLEKDVTAYTEHGKLINSDKFNNTDSENIKKEITKYVGGKWITKFKLRDWIFSRQRYWGEPIPVVHCEKCGIVPLAEKDLPLKLPKIKTYKPTETGESPLASLDKWVNTKCPTCKGKAKRETDTMPNWAGSSWYYLRYVDPKNKKVLASPEKLKHWTPVDWYNGGMEHTTLHLLYSRFWHKFLFDIGVVPTSEPYMKRTSHGLILAENGEKMSKSRGNVINPDIIVKAVGADTLRVHEMFMGPFDQAIAWDTNTIAGSRRFIERIWKLQEKLDFKLVDTDEETETLIHKTIKKVSSDIEDMKFNTAISSIMILLNQFEKNKNISKYNYEILIQLLAPFAPHVSEEIWSSLKNKVSVHKTPWPQFDPSKLVESTVTLSIQINAKMRGNLKIALDTPDKEIEETVLKMDEIKKWTDGKKIERIIIVKNRLINIIIGNI